MVRLVSGTRRITISLRELVTSLATTYRSNRSTRIAVNAILGAGIGLVVVSVAIDLLGFLNLWTFETWAFSLTRDRSIPEFYGYLMSVTVIVSLVLAFRVTHLYSTRFVALLYGYILFDDALGYHEHGGEALVDLLDIEGGQVPPIIFGELLAWGLAAMVLDPLLLWCLVRCQPADFGVYLLFALIFVATTVFGAGVDALHLLSSSSASLSLVLGWVEDGGELIMLSCAAVCALLYQQGGALAHRGLWFGCRGEVATSSGVAPILVCASAIPVRSVG